MDNLMEDWNQRSFEKETFAYVLKMYIFKIVKNDSFSRLDDLTKGDETKEFSQIEKNETIIRNYIEIIIFKFIVDKKIQITKLIYTKRYILSPLIF